MLFDALLAPALQTALRGYLRLDPETAVKLNQLAGKLIGLHIDGPGVALFIMPADDTVRVRAGAEREPDTTIRGTPAAFMRLGLNRHRANPLVDSGIEVRGDTETGRVFHEVLSAVEFDWEGALAGRVGDIPAHQLGNLARGLTGWLTETRQAWRRDAGVYLTAEARLIPARREVEYFMDAVDTLRSDIDRLEARIRRLDAAPEAERD